MKAIDYTPTINSHWIQSQNKKGKKCNKNIMEPIYKISNGADHRIKIYLLLFMESWTQSQNKRAPLMDF